MSNKSLEIAEHWINQQRMSFERKDSAEDVIRNIAKDVAAEEVNSHVSSEHCDDCEYAY